jgi:hypothetical protein
VVLGPLQLRRHRSILSSGRILQRLVLELDDHRVVASQLLHHYGSTPHVSVTQTRVSLLSRRAP